ncbi:hypothetical protein [Rhodopirellula islandica]|uniref:hypothetical protein n=1 Tax=Rhodopirellula islandica TaxID=595434 RepID=UPI000A7B76EF|nr:hypothetical protein [Rhodopirellula islandica]
MKIELYQTENRGSNLIRLGNFVDERGGSWCPSDPRTARALNCELVHGTQFVDFPGTFSAVGPIVSNRIFEEFKGFSIHPSLDWIRTVVDGHKLPLEQRVFWVGHFDYDELPIVTVPDPEDEFFGPRRLATNAQIDSKMDFVVDSDTQVLFSSSLKNHLTKFLSPEVHFVELGRGW